MLLSIGDQVRPGSYRPHSVFKRVVNFERRGRLVSVVDESIGPGPVNIVLRDLKLAQAQGGAGTGPSILKGLHNSAQGWIAGEWGGYPTLGKLRRVSNPERVEAPTCNTAPLQISTRAVLFAGRRYPFTARHCYHSAIELRAADPDRFEHNLSILGDALLQAAPSKSLAFLLDRQRRKHLRAGFERAYAAQIERGVRQVFHGRLLEGIRRLKGCGVGLTPGGDDFIAGLLIGLHLRQKLCDQDLRSVRDRIFRVARGNNIFSNTFLDLARRGLVSGPMRDLILALMAGIGEPVRQAVAHLCALGATSGADMATGLLLTLQARARTDARRLERPTRKSAGYARCPRRAPKTFMKAASRLGSSAPRKRPPSRKVEPTMKPSASGK